MCIVDITCLNDHRRFTEPHPGARHALWLQRAGAFLHRVDGRESYLDSTRGIVLREGEERQVAHPVGTSDVGTEIRLPAELALRLPAGPFVTTTALNLVHRTLIAACRRGVDGFELSDRLHSLIRLVPAPDRVVRRSPAIEVQHRRAVTQVRAALVDGGLLLGLDDLAKLVGYSPHHLSRLFKEVTRMTLTAYRNELRVRAVLEDLYAGEHSLRALAGRYGFADQSHLTRVMRRHVGEPPSLLRSLISA
ncbi:helix-turn-helix transcriptional regulator [Nonomuraea sp. NPDC049480]|uniref:helix-turn-helix transcriptional regulator n=1 Tax=Nonomuraea sp. NPDC049480 TaxID=3364353 RepID=UPI0037B79468